MKVKRSIVPIEFSNECALHEEVRSFVRTRTLNENATFPSVSCCHLFRQVDCGCKLTLLMLCGLTVRSARTKHRQLWFTGLAWWYGKHMRQHTAPADHLSIISLKLAVSLVQTHAPLRRLRQNKSLCFTMIAKSKRRGSGVKHELMVTQFNVGHRMLKSGQVAHLSRHYAHLICSTVHTSQNIFTMPSFYPYEVVPLCIALPLSWSLSSNWPKW